MTATDELRRMLTEAGVEWRDYSDENVLHTTWDSLNCWFNEYPDGWTAWGMAKHGTPAQAIAATVGRGTCHDVYPNATYCFTCSECGHVRRFIQGWNNATDSSQDEFNYCPNCGRKVVDE